MLIIDPETKALSPAIEGNQYMRYVSGIKDQDLNYIPCLWAFILMKGILYVPVVIGVLQHNVYKLIVLLIACELRGEL